MKKTFLLLSLCVLFASRVTAQVADSAAIARFWNDYYERMLDGGKRSDFWQSRYNLIERDFVKAAIRSERNLPHRIGRIEALNDSVSVITVFTHSGNRGEWYKVGVLRQEGGYKLVDYFQSIKGGLLREKSRYIDLYSLKSGVPNGKKRDRFVEELNDFYGFEPGERIEYFFCSDLEECFHAAGIGFSKGWGFIHSRGYTIFGTLIFTGKRFHPHELVHAVMAPRYPDAAAPLHEGLALYHSRAGRKKNLGRFRRYVEGREELSAEQIGRYKGAGYLLVDHAQKNGGPEKVLALLSHTDLDEMLEKEFGVVPGKRREFFVSLLSK